MEASVGEIVTGMAAGAIVLEEGGTGRRSLATIDRGIVGNQTALETGKRLGDSADVDCPTPFGKCGAKQLPIACVAVEAAYEFGLLFRHSHFDRLRAEERNESLRLQAGDPRIAPGQTRQPCDVGQARYVAEPLVAMHSWVCAGSIGEAALLLVAGGTGHRAVDR